MDKNNKFYRFKIIEPFLKKEMKLKDIAKINNISYATLKRWVARYKEEGVLGLENKDRIDKNNHRISNKTLDKIKKNYMKSDETNISKIYKKLNLSISYSTFYRVINNIDEFFNSPKTEYIGKIKKINECYLVLNVPLYILVKNKNKKSLPHLLLMLDVATLEIIDFTVSFEYASFFTILGFIRNSILKISIKNKTFTKPKDILVSSEAINRNSILKNIYKNTKIRIIEHYTDNLQIRKFLDFLGEDIKNFYEEHDKNVNFMELNKFLTYYLYLYKPAYAFSVNYKLTHNLDFIRKMDIFLDSTTRKIYNSKIRLKNNIYTLRNLKISNGTNVILRFAPNISDVIYIFNENDSFLDFAFINI